MEEEVILVDGEDNELGVMDKLAAHQHGLLHRAFSVFVFNSKGELLLQQRADHKYHSAGLWTNTCCSHPRRGENLVDAVSRRLMEEMGMQCQPEHKFSFKYKIRFENGLTEHEFDHVFFAHCDEQAVPNPEEVKATRYITLEKLQEEIRLYPEKYSAWIQICLPGVMEVS